MQVETARSGTELAAFAGVALALLGGVLPWLHGGRVQPVEAGVTLLLGIVAGGVLLYRAWEPVDRAAILGIGLTLAALVFGTYGRFTEGGIGSADPGIGLLVSGIGGAVLVAAGAHGCWTCGVVSGTGGRDGDGTGSESHGGAGRAD